MKSYRNKGYAILFICAMVLCGCQSAIQKETNLCLSHIETKYHDQNTRGICRDNATKLINGFN